MDNLRSFLNKYWNYYLCLEKQFLNTCNFVSLEKENFNTFSNEYLALLQLICSEVDIVSKYLVKQAGFAIKNEGFLKCFPLINSKYPVEISVTLNENPDICLNPFHDYIDDSNESFVWWSAYNKVKHSRMSFCKADSCFYYQKANMCNVLNALCALFILERVYIREIGGNDILCLERKQSNLFESVRPIAIFG